MKFKLFDEVQVKNEPTDVFLAGKKGIIIKPGNKDSYTVRFLAVYGDPVDFDVPSNDLVLS